MKQKLTLELSDFFRIRNLCLILNLFQFVINNRPEPIVHFQQNATLHQNIVRKLHFIYSLSFEQQISFSIINLTIIVDFRWCSHRWQLCTVSMYIVTRI